MDKNLAVGGRLKDAANYLWREGTVYIILAALIVMFSFINPLFFSWRNIYNLISESSFLIIAGMGIVFVMISGGMDLSVGYQMAMVSSTSFILMDTFSKANGGDVPGWFVLVIFIWGAFLGFMMGLLNGMIITKLKLFPLIVTIATSEVFKGICFTITNSKTYSGLPATVTVDDAAMTFVPVGANASGAEAPADAGSQKNISYASNSDAQICDVYVPEGADKAPVIVLVHGGGFMFGDQAMHVIQPVIDKALEKGYAVVSVDYRKATEAVFPAAVGDVKAAVRWVRANAVEYGFDPEGIAIWGESAGAYLSLMTALTPDVAQLNADVTDYAEIPSNVKALVSFYAPVEFYTLYEEAGKPDSAAASFESKFLGQDITADKDVTYQTYWETYADAIPTDLMAWIQVGDADSRVPHTQTVNFAERLGNYLPAENIQYSIIPGADQETNDLMLTAVVLFCASGTGIYGALDAGMTGNHSVLIAKSVLDFFTAIIFACQLGKATAFIGIPQGAVLLSLFALAKVIVPMTTDMMVADFKACGGFILVATGLRMMKLKPFPVADMIPAMVLVMPVSFAWVTWLLPLIG